MESSATAAGFVRIQNDDDDQDASLACGDAVLVFQVFGRRPIAAGGGERAMSKNSDDQEGNLSNKGANLVIVLVFSSFRFIIMLRSLAEAQKVVEAHFYIEL